MYVITNRALSDARTIKAFGKTPNPQGPNELRLVRVEPSGKGWSVAPVTNKLSPATVKKLNTKYGLKLDTHKPWHASLQVACELFERARTQKKSILFFVHGYNNDVDDVMRAAHDIEALYKDVIVVPFTWPANGGGVVSGSASYLSDKGDARASAGALNRAIGKIQEYHLLLTAAMREKLNQQAMKKHPDNPTEAGALYAKLVARECNVKINLLCHSMGNYVFKHTFATSFNATSKLVFDNVCLVAADANNAEHARWVGQVDTRNRVYVVINEDDFALKASRMKPGDEQKARLGHYTKLLNSPNAHYLDLTGVDHIGNAHTYFKGETVEKNERVRALFYGMFIGESVEHLMTYRGDNNSYKF